MDVDDHVEITERLIRALEIVAAYVLVLLFGIGVFDLGLSILELVRTGKITQTQAVVGLIDTVLLLFIIVEIYHTVVAYAREKSVLRIVLITGVIAVTRRIISYHPTEYPSAREAFLAAAGFSVLLGVLVVSLYVVSQTTDQTWEI